MSIDLQLSGHQKDLGGGFMVRRLLPAAKQQAVGPFIFFDHFGPVTEQPDINHDVRPHPHIGLATVTYLFEGAMMHRDSIGSAQRIEPGAINWMTAGRGIVHSERAPDDLRDKAYVNHGLQLWAALPKEFEETSPSFSHTPADIIPEVTVDGVKVRVLIGEAFGKVSPVKTFSKTLYLDVQLAAGDVFVLPPLAAEMAVYPVDGDLRVDAETLAVHTMATLVGDRPTAISADQSVRFVIIGGDALDGHRFMWWNFVSSSKERIVQASNDWEAQAMGKVPNDNELIPLPERRFSVG